MHVQLGFSVGLGDNGGWGVSDSRLLLYFSSYSSIFIEGLCLVLLCLVMPHLLDLPAAGVGVGARRSFLKQSSSGSGEEGNLRVGRRE